MFFWLNRYLPESRSVRQAQVALLYRHSRYQTLVAPVYVVFFVVVLTEFTSSWTAAVWTAALLAVYGLRALTLFPSGDAGIWARRSGLRFGIFAVALAAAGLLWAAAPLVLSKDGSTAQVLVALAAGLAVLMGIIANYLYFWSAVVYTVFWVIPMTAVLGSIYQMHMGEMGWTFILFAAVIAFYCLKALDMMTVFLADTMTLNEALHREKERAEAADRAKSDFLAMMSHELRTPLNAITGYSEIIRDGLYGPDAHDRYAEHAGRIRQGAGMLSSMINDMLDLSDLQYGNRQLHIEQNYVRAIVDTVIDLVRSEVERKEIVVDNRVAEDFPLLTADNRAVVQCMTNILGNAVKYSPTGSEISIDAALGDDTIVLSVRDTGPGIAADEVPRIVEAFRRGSSANTSSSDGVGLGLAIANLLMKRQGGRLEIDSRLGEGTTVRLVFPRNPAPAANGGNARGGTPVDDVKSGAGQG